MMTVDEELRQLRWQCRRGLLELDLSLRAFVDRRYSSLSPTERAAFRRLLEVPDTQLHAWLNDATEVPDHEFRQLVKEIR